MTNARRLLTTIILCVFSFSCRTGLPVKRFRNHEDAGSIAVSIQSIAPFDEQYIEQLQPKVEMPADAAAITQTQIRQIQQLRQALVEAGFGLPSSTVSETKTTTNKKDAQPVEFSTTETKTPPDLEKLPSGPASDAKVPDVIALANTTLALDTALSLRAKAALQQEIALLNRYVRDAAVTRGTRPYVVRLLVTLNPSARFEPYDAYTAISLFSATPVVEPPPLFFNSDDIILKPLVRDAANGACGKTVEAIPLFVTDNIESSLDSIAGARSIGFKGGVNGIVQNIGGKLGANIQSQDVEKAQARTLNSLQTISRLSGNTVETRFGAMNAAGGYQMLARTYNVTVLVLVPTLRGYLDALHPPTGKDIQEVTAKDAWKSGYQTLSDAFRAAGRLTENVNGITVNNADWISGAADEVLLCNDVAFSALSRFVDADNGITLRSHFETLAVSLLQMLAQNWGIQYEGNEKLLNELLTFAQYDSYDEFAKHAAKTGRPDLNGKRPEPLRMFWLDFISIARASGRLSGRFALPQDGFRFFAGDRGTLFDDGKAATITLVGSKNLSKTALEGSLLIDETHVLANSAVDVAADGRRATFTFPSPFKLLNLKTKATDTPVEPQKLRLEIRRGGGSKPFEPQIIDTWTAEYPPLPPPSPRKILSYLRIPETPKDETPKVTMEVTAPHIIITTADAGGTFAVSFRTDADPKPKVRFNVDGGYIVGTIPNTAEADADRVADSNQTYIVAVKNLSRGGKLTLRAFQATDKGARGPAITPKTIDVLAQPEASEARRGIVP
jgi:hypothetical protein